MQRLERSNELAERLRHLDCLFGISQLRERPGISLWGVLEGAVELMPPAMRFAEVACARIVLNGQQIRSANFAETPWKLGRDIVVWGKPAGQAEVYYLEERPLADEGPFLDGEQRLLGAIAERLGKVAERMEIEAALRATEERYRAVSELTSDLAYAFLVRPDGTLESEWVTEAITGLTGYGPEELDKHRGWTATIHPEDRAAAQRHLETLLAGRQHAHELRIITRDGQVRWLRDHGRPIWDKDQGRVARIYGAARDITESKLAQQALQDSEETFRGVFEQSRDGISLVDEAGLVIGWNQAMQTITGLAAQDVLGKPRWEVQFQLEPPEQRTEERYRQLKDMTLDALRSGEGSWLGQLTQARYTRADGSQRHVAGVVYPIHTGQGIMLGSVVRDVTGRVRAERELKETSRLLETILAHTPILVAYLDTEFNFVLVNRAYAAADDRKPEFFKGRNHFDLYPDQGNEAIFRQVLETGQPHFVYARPFEYADHPERGMTHWDWSLIPITNGEGTVTGLVLSLADVTERVRAAEALRESEHRFRKLFEQTLIGIITSGPQGELTAVNPAMLEILGYDNERELLGQPAEAIWFDPADRVRALQVANDFGYLPVQEVRLKRKDGSVAHFLVTATLDQDKQGRYQGLTATYTDIGDLKEAEEKLQWELTVDAALYALYEPLISAESSIQHIANQVLEQARRVTASAHGFVSAIDPVTRDNVGYTLTEMLEGECTVRGEARRTTFPIGSDGRYGGLWGHALNTKEPFYTSSPNSHPAAKGTPLAHIPLEQFLSVPVLLGDELVGQIALANPDRDYTERDLIAIQRMSEFYALAIQRRRAERALQASEEKYRDLVENIHDVIYDLDANGIVTYVSPAIESLLGYSVSEAMGSHYSHFLELSGDPIPPGRFPRLDPGNTLVPRKVRALTKAGELRWIRTSGQARMIEGRVAGLRGVLTDVTEQVEADLQLKAALAEKDTLLKEIHHRVKNNLQLISALLSLQSRATDDARLTTAFEESQHRILSMAGIHEHLYRSKDLSRVDMGAYIRELADELEHSYGTPAVAIQSEADEILLDIDRAIPCGLIVNELVSNALKHAFPLQDHQVGEIHISMHSVPGQDGQIELVVCDNGVGLPVDVEVAEAKTLGLTMVNLLSRQLRAELEVHRNQGTSVRITFSI